MGEQSLNCHIDILLSLCVIFVVGKQAAYFFVTVHDFYRWTEQALPLEDKLQEDDYQMITSYTTIT